MGRDDGSQGEDGHEVTGYDHWQRPKLSPVFQVPERDETEQVGQTVQVQRQWQWLHLQQGLAIRKPE